jgi:hypothetical protein
MSMLIFAAATAATVDYGNSANWLCQPGRADACAISLDATVINADGSRTTEATAPAKDPKFDCFYVYPTLSHDPTPNSDLVPNDEERMVVAAQFARFSTICRTFAPMYRQVTLTALRSALLGKPLNADSAMAYGDVRAAFNHYISHDNGGRPFLLIGHSQGSRWLTQLVKDEIDGKPLQGKMLSAMLIGSNVLVPKGKDVGGDFKTVPLCRKDGQTGCIITYVSFRSDAPPPANSRFGRSADSAMEVGCANPAALGGGAGTFDAYLGRKGAGESSAPAPAWTSDGKAVETDFVKVPGLLSGSCRSDANGSYLAVKVNADPNDPRTDNISGDVVAGGAVLADWGLHLVDVSIPLGNLIQQAELQATAHGQGDHH